jgi:hypothetical protein
VAIPKTSQRRNRQGAVTAPSPHWNAGRLDQLAAGGILILMGLAMVTAHLSTLFHLLLDAIPALGRIGWETNWVGTNTRGLKYRS